VVGIGCGAECWVERVWVEDGSVVMVENVERSKTSMSPYACSPCRGGGSRGEDDVSVDEAAA
jgi:hypothetical protein